MAHAGRNCSLIWVKSAKMKHPNPYPLEPCPPAHASALPVRNSQEPRSMLSAKSWLLGKFWFFPRMNSPSAISPFSKYNLRPFHLCANQYFYLPNFRHIFGCFLRRGAPFLNSFVCPLSSSVRVSVTLFICMGKPYLCFWAIYFHKYFLSVGFFLT